MRRKLSLGFHKGEPLGHRNARSCTAELIAGTKRYEQARARRISLGRKKSIIVSLSEMKGRVLS